MVYMYPYDKDGSLGTDALSCTIKINNKILLLQQQQQQHGTSPSRQQPTTETTSFIEPDPIKVKKLVSQYGVNNGMAQ